MTPKHKGQVSIRPSVHAQLQATARSMSKASGSFVSMSSIVEAAIAPTLAQRREIEVSSFAFKVRRREALRRGVTIDVIVEEMVP